MRARRSIVQAVKTADLPRTEQLLRLLPWLARTDGLLHLAVSSPRSLGGIGRANFGGTEDRLKIVKLLIAHGAEVDSRDTLGETPLMRAVSQGSDALAELLLERGADPNAVSWNGETPLHRAVQKRRLALLPTLLSFEADMEAKDGRGLTPLQVAHDDDIESVSDIFSRYEGAQRYINSFGTEATASEGLYSPDLRAGARFVSTLVTTGVFAL